MPVKRKKRQPATTKASKAFRAAKRLDPTSVVREGEFKKKKLLPRAPGSERSFAFTSVNSKGKKVTRFSDKPTPRKGEKRKRFK